MKISILKCFLGDKLSHFSSDFNFITIIIVLLHFHYSDMTMSDRCSSYFILFLKIQGGISFLQHTFKKKRGNTKIHVLSVKGVETLQSILHQSFWYCKPRKVFMHFKLATFTDGIFSQL